MTEKKYTLSLFIFRRDLRIEDNKGLYHALDLSEKVLTAFIFDPEQVGTKNSYKSENCLQFMHESLIDLSQKQKEKGKITFF